MKAFISHSSPDDRYVQEFVQLVRSLGYVEVFNDSHSIQPDQLFWPRIEQGIRDCDAFVVILSHASAQSYWVGREVEFAREQGKKVVPIRIDDCRVPSSFEGRDVIELRQGRGDRVKIAASRLSRHAARNFFGREQELKLLDTAWADPGTHVLSIVAWGGVGKTSLITQWVATRMVAAGWTGVERFFDWSFYSQGTGDSRQTSADLFINEALSFFGDPDPVQGSPWERGERLARLVSAQKTLLVLDGIEPLQYPPTDRSGQAGRLKDQALEALLQSLVQDNTGLCIVTTREHLANIDSYPTQKEHKLDKLTLDAAIGLIRHLRLIGTDEEIQELWEALDGHALSLLQLGRLLARGYGKDLRKWREIGFTQADKLHQGRSTMKVMAKYESWLAEGDKEQQLELAILRLMGLFERPMVPGCFEALRASPAIANLTELFASVERIEVESAVTTLVDNELLSHGGGDDYCGSLMDVSLDAHPLIREYFAAQLQREQPAAFLAAHSRLFDYLCEHTPYCPDGLDGLAPLYEAVTHGCLAGRQQEALYKVYFDRIHRGQEVYSTFKLGAIGANLAAVAAFFDEPWRQVSPSLSATDQAWLLAEAAFSLRALGRLTEALQPMRAGMPMRVQQKNWKNAAINAGNLSELELTLGRFSDAVTDARQSITHADQSGDEGMRMITRTTAADALHQSGQRMEAGTLFAEAERMQQEIQPQFDLLYSLQGFQYCDWLLAPAEQAAWQQVLNPPGGSTDFQSVTLTDGQDVRRPERCARSVPHTQEGSESQISDGLADVERRGNKMFEWRVPGDPLLEIALDHLTLARVGLIRAILGDCPSRGAGSSPVGTRSGIQQNADRRDASPPDDSASLLATALPQPTLALPHVAAAAAVNGLRAAGQVQYLPFGLLTAALYHFIRGEHDLARKNLTEAQQIAERGPMPLFLADVHLHRARMFCDRTALALAAKLIRAHGYGRRYQELADAEAVIGNADRV